jgi:hypothetical protein
MNKMKTAYNLADMSFPGPLGVEEKLKDNRLTKKELQVLTKLLNGIRKGVYFETMMHIVRNSDDVTLYTLTDKLNEIAGK